MFFWWLTTFPCSGGHTFAEWICSWDETEVAVETDPETYWVATIITTCEQLLLLRYDGYGEDRRADFWCDIRKADLYPIGWCEQNKKTLEAPEGNGDTSYQDVMWY